MHLPWHVLENARYTWGLRPGFQGHFMWALRAADTRAEPCAPVVGVGRCPSTSISTSDLGATWTKAMPHPVRRGLQPRCALLFGQTEHVTIICSASPQTDLERTRALAGPKRPPDFPLPHTSCSPVPTPLDPSSWSLHLPAELCISRGEFI